MVTKAEYLGLRSELVLLRKQNIQSAYGTIPASVEHLERMLTAAASDDERVMLYALLVSECSKAGNERLYIDCLRHRTRDFPNDPMSHAGLAFSLVTIGREHRDEALATAKKALELAKSQNRQIRYCAINLARIALAIDDYGAVNHALEELIADSSNHREEDIGYEFDFVERIDAQRVNETLFARYKALEQQA